MKEKLITLIENNSIIASMVFTAIGVIGSYLAIVLFS